jgi:hypothetical protein
MKKVCILLVLIIYLYLVDSTSMDLRNIGVTSYTYTVPTTHQEWIFEKTKQLWQPKIV